MGRNCIRELLRHAPERLVQVYVAEAGPNPPAERARLIESLEEADVAVEMVSPEHLTALAGSQSHQSFVAVVRPVQSPDLKTFLARTEPHVSSVILMLDEINDPQNLGAILRAAECFAVDAVVWSRNRGCGLTPVVSKASAGASELATLIQVSNLVDAISKVQEAGYTVVAAEAVPGAVPVEQYEFPARTAVVMGSEGRGLRHLVRSRADVSVVIPLYGRIESLNVSQATAVMLHCLRQASAARGPGTVAEN